MMYMPDERPWRSISTAFFLVITNFPLSLRMVACTFSGAFICNELVAGFGEISIVIPPLTPEAVTVMVSKAVQPKLLIIV